MRIRGERILGMRQGKIKQNMLIRGMQLFGEPIAIGESIGGRRRKESK